MNKTSIKENYIQVNRLIKIHESVYRHNIKELKECHRLELGSTSKHS